jgi:hypothetical protein
MEAFFNNLPSTTKRHRLSDEHCNPQPPQSCHTEAVTDKFMPPVPPSPAQEAAAGAGEPSEEDATTAQAIAFHTSADHIMAILSRLQTLVKIKQSLLNADSGGKFRPKAL